MKTRSKIHLKLKLNAGLSLLMLFIFSDTKVLFASDVISASKDCSTSPCTAVVGGNMGIATAQSVHWEANYNPSAVTEGDGFFLSTDGTDNSPDITISSALNVGFNQGSFPLPAGNYHISIKYFGMGSGSYSITFNQQASFAVVPPTSFDFGNILQGQSSPNHTFSLTLTGDMLPVDIISIDNPDPAHFQVTGPSSTLVPTSFQVKYLSCSAPCFSGATLTIHGHNSSGLTVADKTVTLNGATIPNVPKIECVGADCAGAPFVIIDGDVGATVNFNKSFNNSGTNVLHITSIILHQNDGGVFSLNGSPNITDLAAGSTRTVSIHFAPPPGEHIFCGSIIIQSNDPDHPTLECFFSAKAHHPVPKMVVEENDLNYHDVELGFSFTKAIIVRNDGDANLVIDMVKVDPADPDLPQWSSTALATHVTIVPLTNQAFQEVFTPTALGGPYSFQIKVSGNDLLNSSQTVTLHGNGVAPVPIDNVLVLDRSGSMSESAGTQTKIEALHDAANLYVDLLRKETGSQIGDKIGIVKYNQDNSDYLSFDFKTDAHYTDAQNALSDGAINDLSKLKPDGTTGIGGAMQRAANMLGPSTSPRRIQVMVVMTDGIQNQHPFIGEVLSGITTANPDLQLYSLGLGDDIDGAALQSITNKGAGGYHQVSGDLLGNNKFALEEFYFKIYSNASGANLIVDPTEAVNLSAGVPVIVYTADVVSSDRYATFLVLDDPVLRKYYNLQLIDPSGQVINLGSSVGGIPVQVMQRLNYSIYKVIFPDVSQSSTYVGTWVLRLNPNGKWNQKNARDSTGRYLKTPGEYIQPAQGLVPIGFAAAVRSDYDMQVTATANSYEPGGIITLTAKLTDRGWPSYGSIHLTSTKPDGSISNFILFDDGSHNDDIAGDGVYTNTFSQTASEGSYKFFFDATGTNTRGELVPRQATRYVSLYIPSTSGNEPPPGKPCLPYWADWLMLILSIIIIALIVRCCAKMSIR